MRYPTERLEMLSPQTSTFTLIYFSLVTTSNFLGTHSLHLPLFTPSTRSGLRLSSDGLHNTYLRSSSSPTGNRILTQISLLHSNHVRNLLAGINRWIQEAVARHN
jgi:hypothetical protein